MEPKVPLTQDENALVERHVPMVRRVVLSTIYCNERVSGMAYDDLYQEGCMALCAAPANYQEDRGEFEPYAAAVIRNHLLDYCRALGAGNRCQIMVQLEALEREEQRFEEASDDLLDSTNEEEMLSRIHIKELLAKRKRRYKGAARLGVEALELMVLEGRGVTDIAGCYGAQPNLVGAWVSKAKKRIRSDLTKSELEGLGRVS